MQQRIRTFMRDQRLMTVTIAMCSLLDMSVVGRQRWRIPLNRHLIGGLNVSTEDTLRQQAFVILSRLQSGTEDVVRLSDALEAIAAEREDMALDKMSLFAEIERLQASRGAEGDRLDWLLCKLPGNVLRDLVGELSDTSDVAEWRAAIDRAAGFLPPNAR